MEGQDSNTQLGTRQWSTAAITDQSPPCSGAAQGTQAHPHLQPLHFFIRGFLGATNVRAPALIEEACKHPRSLPLGQHDFQEHVLRFPELPCGAERHLLAVETS